MHESVNPTLSWTNIRVSTFFQRRTLAKKLDVSKFPSIPWLALFGVMKESGLPKVVLRYLSQLYAHLQHRFWYGQVDGSEWTMATGLLRDAGPG